MPDRSDVPDFTVSLRGYDRQQVEEYVQRLTLDLDQALRRAADAEQRAASPQSSGGGFAELGPHVAGVLERAQHEADQLRAEARAYAEQVRGEADRAAHDLQALAGSEAATTAAQRDALLAEARARADELLQRSQKHADRRAAEIVTAAEREAQALHAQLDVLREERDQALRAAREAAHRLLAAADAGAANDEENASAQVRA